MVDAFMVIATIAVIVILLVANIYLLAVYCHPDEKGFGDTLFLKILVVMGMSLAWGQVLMLPLDVANSRGLGGGFDMEVFWQVIIILDAVLLVILIPFSIFFYEADPEKGFGKRLSSALCMFIGFFIIFALIFFIMFGFLSEAEIPVKGVTIALAAMQASDTDISSTDLVANENLSYRDYTLNISVSFPIFTMAFLSFVGWFLLVIFGGTGLFAIPMDMINTFRNKPVQKSPTEIIQQRDDIGRKAVALQKEGEELEHRRKSAEEISGFLARRKEKNAIKKDYNKFNARVQLLQKFYEIHIFEANYAKLNPIVFVFKLIGGIILMIIAFFYWLHILLSSAITTDGFPEHVFFNDILLYFDEDVDAAFIAAFVFAGFALYLIWAVTKGNIKFGVRIPFCFVIHPMVKDETMMNSFLFNVELVLIASMAVVQFLTESFSQYVRLTAIDNLVGTQVKYMQFFSFFFNNNVFEIIFLIWSMLAFFYLVFCGGENRKLKKQYEKLQKEAEKAGKKASKYIKE